MTTQREIYNMALANLGVSKKILDTSAPDKNREILDVYWNVAVKQMLADFDWGFASNYRTLTVADNKPINKKYEFAYDYPNDVLSPREIIGENVYVSFSNEKEKLQVVNYNGTTQIWCNVENAILRYTQNINEVGKFSNEFVIALSWLLAYFACPSVVGSRTQHVDCYQEYKEWCSSGQTIDANKDNNYDDYVNEWIEARG